jgi:hypothetical protein
MPATPSDFISPDSLNWALTHVLRYGEGDIFPRAFEFEAYKTQWPEVLAHLSKIDLSSHEVGCSLKLLVPKGKWGYRVGTQLDPFDHLLYTAMVHEVAPTIEGFRVAKAKQIACAYRLDLDANGQFFQRNSGWPDFHERSTQLAKASTCKFVACADISDFYNQTSHHRIQNALSSANVQEERANSVEHFLGNINSRHHSRGLPVGPFASILLAEACLADVDNFLIRKGYSHTRYVDDFRIFCTSHGEAVSAFHDLSQYLYTAHRLSFQSNKTLIMGKAEFQEEELVDPEQLEIQSKQEKIHALLDQVEYSPYEIVDESSFELDDSTEAELLRESIGDLFGELVGKDSLHVGLARYLLRRAGALRTRVILNDVLINIEFLLPVFRDAVNYLVQVYDKKRPQQVGDVLQHLVTKSDYRHLPYIQYWVLRAFAEAPALCDANVAIGIAENSDTEIRDRISAMVAKSYRLADWVRSRKETWQNSTPFGQRAIIWAAPILPKDERTHWLKSISNYPVFSIASLAKAVLAGAGKV